MSFLVNSYALGWTPSELGSALALWLDAADAGTITLNGSTVSRWNDKSGNSRHISQANPALQPSYQAPGLNGYPIVDFERARGTWLQTNSFPTTSIPAIGIVSVVRWQTVPGIIYQDIQTIVDNNHTSTPSQGFIWQDRPDLANRPLTVGHLPNDIIGAIDITTTGNNTWKIIASRFVSGGNDFLYINGGAERSAINGGVFNLNNVLRIGGSVNFGRSFNGEIAEKIITTVDLSTADRQKLEGYLAHKWGLVANLPSNHPYKTVAP